VKRSSFRRMPSAIIVVVLVAVGSLAWTASALAASTAPPMIASESVSHITEHDATLNAHIDPNGLETTYQFRLESGCLPPLACLAITTYPLPSGEIPASYEINRVSLDLNNAGVTLQPATKYRYSVEATNSDGTTKGPDQTFTTPPGTQEPLIEGKSVSNITPTDATLEVQIYPGGLETSYEVWLGTVGCIEENLAATCESTKFVGTIPASFSTQTVSVDVAKAWHNLSPSTQYVYTVRASNSAGTGEGGDYAFFETRSASTPLIESESVSHLTQTDATLEAQINTEGLETTYTFYLHEEGPPCLKADPPCMVLEKAPIALPSGKLLGSFVGQNVSADLNSAGVSLSPGARYEYWVTATNAAGATRGQPQSFTAPSEPGAEPLTESKGSTNLQGSTTIQSPPSTAPSHYRRHHQRHKRGLRRRSKL
jgi:hypothetical protein